MIELAPFVVQGIVMSVDEFVCHTRRELRLWERLGHPLDTLAFIACLGWLLLRPVSILDLKIFVGFAVFSTLLITKDEWQHRELCSGFENWLHALLFVLHPLVLIWAGWLWWTGDVWFLAAVGGSTFLAALFFIYQVVFWNLLKRHA